MGSNIHDLQDTGYHHYPLNVASVYKPKTYIEMVFFIIKIKIKWFFNGNT